MRVRASIGFGVVAVAILSLLAGTVQAADEKKPGATIVPLVTPLGKGGDVQLQGLFRKVVTAQGFEIDAGRAGLHKIKAIEVTDTFSSNAPEVYVVVEFLQSTFDIFVLVGRFILEDPDGKPVGTLLHTDRAQFENEDMGGFLLMRRPPGGFPVGNYRVEIHYEAVTAMSLLRLVHFKVVPTNP